MLKIGSTPSTSRRRRCLQAVALAPWWLISPSISRSQTQPKTVAIIVPSELSPRRLQAIEIVKKRLAELGWREGIEIRYLVSGADFQPSRLAAAVADAKANHVDLIFTMGDTESIARLAQFVGGTLPIVVGATGALLQSGLIKSYANPGGNITGMDLATFATSLKSIELLKTMVPEIRRFGILVANSSTDTPAELRALLPEVQIQAFNTSTPERVEQAITEMGDWKLDAIWIDANPMTIPKTALLAAQTLRLKIPSVGEMRGYCKAGGLLQFGVDADQTVFNSTVIVDKVLRGARPSDVPVERPKNFNIAVNLITARELGIRVPKELLVRANEVIS